MDLLALKYFCEAAERESFSRVAEKNLVPTSSISQVSKHTYRTKRSYRHGTF